MSQGAKPERLARELLEQGLGGAAPAREALAALVACATDDHRERARQGTRALFGVLVERLGDLFEPRLCDFYAELFCAVIEQVIPELRARELRARYERVRRVRRFAGDGREIERVIVLSRVTLGADVAVTSVLLDAAKRRFPGAEIYLAGNRKNWELFAADARIGHLPVGYGRDAALPERLAAWPALREAASGPGTLVLDPDSRLTQLGLLPVCPEERYLFFESRAYGGQGMEPLPELARRWVEDTLGIPDARAYVAPCGSIELAAEPLITMSLGVGGNAAKRVADPFEQELVAAVARRDATVLVDTGEGGEEAERVERAIRHAGARRGRIRTWRGAFAPFAAAIAGSRLYLGYDSAGQHVAAACGTPLITIFGGFASPRTLARWSPAGPGPKATIRVEDPDPRTNLRLALEALERLYPAG